jgi:acetylornithine aminotransferase
MGDYLLDTFKDRLAHLDGIREVRGLGLMIGIELEQDCTELVKHALEKQLLINVTAGNVIRLLPPLILDQQQAETIVDTVSELVIDTLQNKAAA